MPTLEIATYRVGVTRRASDEISRYLFLEPAAGRTGTETRGVRIHFEPNPDEIGYWAEDLFLVTLPESFFADMYHIVQTESPAFFNWRLDESGDRIMRCGIGTVEEPTGEGLEDRSR
jgi:hypothetical protein